MKDFKFWGSATVGTKGQLVIPAEAREEIGLKEGEKMLVVSPSDSEAIVIIRPNILEQHLKTMQTNIDKILSTE
jgi:AbrB family looped-hinge helix DNA binding protein